MRSGERGWVAGLAFHAGILVVVLLGQALVPARGPFTVPLADVATGGAVAAASLLACFELVALLASRGRPMPSPRALEGVRWVIVAMLAAWVPRSSWSASRGLELPVILALSIGVSLAARAVARRTGRSLLAAIALAAALARYVHDLRGAGGGAIFSPVLLREVGVTVVPVVAVLAALRRAPLGASEVRRLRMSAWSRDDLALAPLALAYGGAALYVTVVDAPPLVFLTHESLDALKDAPYVGLPAAAFTCGAVFTIARHVRQGDERRARLPPPGRPAPSIPGPGPT